MKYILAYNEDLTFKGFYVEGVQKDIPTPNISINRELWSYLVSLKTFKLKEEFDKKDEYTLDDKDIFEKVEIPEDDIDTTPEPTLDTRMSDIERENANLLLASVEQDIKIKSIEQDLADLMLEISTMMEV